jgi:hypothetical protein
MKCRKIPGFVLAYACIVRLAVGNEVVKETAPAGPQAMTHELTKAAQAIVQDTCNNCHASKKPLSASLFKKHAPASMARHFKKKAELTEEQITLMAQYLSAVRDGKAELPKSEAPKVARAQGKTDSSVKSGKHGDDDQDEEDDDSDD